MIVPEKSCTVAESLRLMGRNFAVRVGQMSVLCLRHWQASCRRRQVKDKNGGPAGAIDPDSQPSIEGL